VCYQGFDPKLAKLISIYHDDAELVGKDTSLQLKLQMTPEQLNIHEQKELQDIDLICKRYPKKVEGYWYKELLLHALYKDCREAQLHSFSDKHDGYGESIHEVLAGNNVFLEPVINYSSKTFDKRYDKFPLIKEMFDYDGKYSSPLFSFPVINLMEFFSNGRIACRPHTPWIVSLDTSFSSYEEWKRITLETFQDGMHILTNQTEFHH